MGKHISMRIGLCIDRLHFFTNHWWIQLKQLDININPMFVQSQLTLDLQNTSNNTEKLLKPIAHLQILKNLCYGDWSPPFHVETRNNWNSSCTNELQHIIIRYKSLLLSKGKQFYVLWLYFAEISPSCSLFKMCMQISIYLFHWLVILIGSMLCYWPTTQLN